jgi:hypothetical protein
VKQTIEDALLLITENAAIVQSIMYDPELGRTSQTGTGRLASEIQGLSERIRDTLEPRVLTLELIDAPGLQ